MIESAWTLFLSAFISSTLLPGGAEALLAYQITEFSDRWFLLVLIATLGNTLGSYVTFAMGRVIAHFYPFKPLIKPQHKRAHLWLERAGPWALLLAWLPIIGDPICLVAGWLKLNPLLSAVTILIGKFARFLFVAALALGYMQL